MAKKLTPAESARLILEARQRGEAIVAVLATSGPATGNRILCGHDGRLTGSFGEPAADERARTLAAHIFQTREARFEGDLFGELFAPAEQLIIFGAGHIGLPLAELGVKLGFDVTVLDDRTEFADAMRFPNAVRVLRLDLAAPLADLRLDAATSVVLVTRAHAHDFDLLRAVLAQATRPRYIGMIGSRRRVRAAFTALLNGGVARSALATVHAPVGLDIGAETPTEIAVSIAAELIRVRRGGASAGLADRERVLDRFFDDSDDAKN